MSGWETFVFHFWSICITNKTKIYIITMRILTTIIMLLVMTSVQAQTLRAVFLNPPGTDDTQEYFEISWTPNTSVAGLTLVKIEGDVSGPGPIDDAYTIPSGQTTGSNGIFLWKANTAVINPAPPAETNIYVADFNPDLENPSTTILLVSGYSGSVGTDLDTDNDGVLNSTPWTTVHSAVSVSDGGATDVFYAVGLSGTHIPFATNVDPEFIFFDDATANWYVADISGTNPGGPYTVNAGEVSEGKTSNSATATTTTIFNGTTMTPGGAASPLPILLKKFEVKAAATTTLLSFTTATEVNNSHFEIERSADGRTFAKIGEVKGAGNSLTEQHYTFTDAQPVAGINYYRLKQVDFDGAFSYSPVQSIVWGRSGTIKLFPSPVVEVMTVEFDEAFAIDANWQIIDMAGRVVSEGVFAAEQNIFTIPVATLTEGVYALRAISGQQVTTQQFKK
jgi:hypothetical protein